MLKTAGLSRNTAKMTKHDKNQIDSSVELTIGIPALNSEQYISCTIGSLLKQEHVSFKLVIVDDGSTDKTSNIVLSFQDPRISIIRHLSPKGMAACQNIIVEKSRTPFITFVKPYQIVFPGALKRMVMRLKEHSTIGQVYCHCLDMQGSVARSLKEFRKRKAQVLSPSIPKSNRLRDLVIPKLETVALRTYRREVFDQVGLFQEGLRHQYDHDMALRLLTRYDTQLVPTFLCGSLKGQTKGLRRVHQSFENLLEGLERILPLGKPSNAQFANTPAIPIRHMLWVPFTLTLGMIRRVRKTKRKALSHFKRLIRQYTHSVSRKLYEALVVGLSKWPIRMWKGPATCTDQGPPRVGYYLWQFPVLSQTFIDREIRALRNVGISVEVVADKHGDIELLDDNAKTLLDSTTYIFPLDQKVARQYVSHFFFRSPISFVNLILFVIGHRYQQVKTLQEDTKLFLKAVYVAGLFKDLNITRVHSPWANRTAFVLLIAAELLRLPLTIQARASDIHRRSDQHALEEKFSYAQVLLTNTRFNQKFLRQFLPEKDWPNIQVIYNGVDLTQFVPEQRQDNGSHILKLLSVARLIEPKGLIYLLEACRFLKERKYRFRCEIIGGVQGGELAYFVLLKKLRREFGLEECVTFSGAQPFNQVLRRYQTADIFILPCVKAQDGSQDITPNSLIEAMAMKLPVISTQSTAIPEIVDDGVNGLLVPPKNGQALAEALMKLMNDGHLRKLFGEQARGKIEQRFDIKKNVQLWVDCFEGNPKKMGTNVCREK